MFSYSHIDDSLLSEAKCGSRKAIDKLISAMEGVTAHIALYYSSRLSDGEGYYEDFAQEARIAVLKALETYEIGRGSFIQYSQYAMRIAVRKYLNDNYRLIKQPKGKTEKVAKLNRALAHFALDGDLHPTDADLMAETGFSCKELKEISEIREMQFVCSLDRPYTDDSDNQYSIEPYDLIPFDQQIILEDVYNEISYGFTADERYIICSLFGIMGYEKKTVSALAKELRLSSASVRNKEKAICQALRSLVA